MNLELAVLLALGVAAINGGTSVLDRIVLSKGSGVQNISTLVFFSAGVSGVLGIIVVPLFTNISFDLSQMQFAAVLAAGLLQVLPLPFYYMAVERSNATRILPLTSTSHIIVVFGAFLFLGEKLSLTGYIGVGLLVLGAVILTSQQSTGKYKLSYGALLAILATVLFGAKSLAMKFALNNMGTGTMIFYTHLFAGVFALLALGWSNPREEVVSIVKGGRKGVLPAFVGQELLSGVASLLRPLSYSLALVSVASPITGVLPAFSFIFILLLGKVGYSVEDFSREEIVINVLSLAIITVGLLTIVLFR